MTKHITPKNKDDTQNHSFHSHVHPVEKYTIAMIGFFAFLQVYSVQAILPILIADLSATKVQIGIAVGATVMAIAFISPFMGMLSDAFGRKVFIVSSLLLLALPTAMIGLSYDVHMLSVWRFLQGICVPGITVVLIAYISEEYRHNIAQMMSYYVAGTVLGGFSGRFFAGHLHDLIGWRYGYVVMAICTLLGALWVLKSLPASRQFTKSGNVKNALSLLTQHAKNPQLLSACLLGGCVLFSLVGCFTFINLHLSDAPYHLGASELANLFSVYLIGMIITPMSSRLIDKFGTAKAIIFAIICSVIGVLMTLLSSLSWVILGLIIMSSGVFVTQAATISYVGSCVNQGRSLASGLYYMGYYGGGSLGAWACAIAYTQGAWTMTVALIVLVQAFALAVVVFLMSRKRPLTKASS